VSTILPKLSEEKSRRRTDVRWLFGFAVFGSLLAVPGLLSVTGSLDLDGDATRTGSRFLVFNIGYIIACGASGPFFKKFGIRPFAVAGLALAAASLTALSFVPPTLPYWWQLLPVSGIGTAAGCISVASLFAIKPWSSRLGACALPRLSLLACLGCGFSSVITGVAYASGWSRFTPIPMAVVALLSLAFCVTERPPLLLVQKRTSPPDPTTLHLRSITAFLLLTLLFVQLGSEWSVAAWLPLFLIHRVGSGPVEAVFSLSFYFLALLLGRAVANRLTARLGRRSLAAAGTLLTLAGCLFLSFATSVTGILIALLVLSGGLAAPYQIVKDILDESLYFEPAFYRGILEVAVSGAMCSAWLLGYVHQMLGVRSLVLFPALGSVVILLLEMLLMFESHLMGERSVAQSDHPVSGRRSS
jgi:MFS family permease